MCAERTVGNEPFAVLLADDFLTGAKNGMMENLVNKYHQTGNAQISVLPVAGKEISKYGVVIRKENTNIVSGLIEKPDFENAPSDLASLGRYVLPPKIFEILKKMDVKKGQEIQLADAIDELAKREIVESVAIEGQRFDCGSVEGYMSAIEYEYKKRKKTS